jgi:hypothetical protein
MVTTTKIRINRAPVLTLWATVVAEQLGYDRECALTLGRAVAGLNAQSKGRRLGIYEASDDDAKSRGSKKGSDGHTTTEPNEPHEVYLLGRAIPVTRTREGTRAAVGGKPDDPAAVERYLEEKFGDSLTDAREAMEELAKSRMLEDLEVEAFGLYEKFRPSVPEGVKGWGAKGELSLEKIRRLSNG